MAGLSRSVFSYVLDGLLFSVIFVGVALAVAWWERGPVLFDALPVCTGECEYSASCDVHDDVGWRGAKLWDVVGTPDVTKYPQLAEAEFIGEFNKSSRTRLAAASVGRVQLLLEQDGKCSKAACTGTLISRDRVLTAAHCSEIKFKPAKVLRAAIRFDFLSEAASGEGTLVELNPAAVESRQSAAAPDFMILQFADAPAVAAAAAAGAVPSKLSAEPPAPGGDLYVVGHPYGAPQIVLRSQCRVRLPRAGAERDSSTVIRHSCGTAPGVSGAPIFDDLSGAVVGIHTQARDKNISDEADIGYGIPLSEIAGYSHTMKDLLSSAPQPSPKAQP